MRAWFKKNLKYLLPALFVAVLLAVPQSVSALGVGEIAGAFAEAVGNTIMDLFSWTFFLILQIAGSIFMFAGLFLELVIKYTIVEMRSFVDNLDSIDLAWRAIRDMINILFIFILLIISINIILGSWGSGPYNKSLIPKVIIVAVFINFSLLFTKVVIDISNIVAFEFYNTAKSIRAPENAVSIGGVQLDTGLTSSIADRLGATAFLTGTRAPVDPNNSFPIFSMMFGTITILVAAFIFFVMAALLLIRFVMFLFLMVTSPIAFIGDLLPQMSSHSKKWREALASQAMFAPIFFALILIVAVIINDDSFVAFGRALGAGQVPGATGNRGAFDALIALTFQYTIVTGLLVAALVAAKQTSNKAGEGFVKWSSKLAGKAAFGGTAALGSLTLGRMGRAAAESGTFNRWAAGTGVTGLIGKGLVRGGEGLGKASFDVRATTLGKDLGAGDAAKGYTERRKAAAKAEGEYIKKASVPVRNPNVQAAKDNLRSVRSRYTEVQRKFEAGEMDLDERAVALREIETQEQQAKQNLSKVRQSSTEPRARHRLARATRKVRVEGIREIEARRKKVEDELKAKNNGKNPKADDVHTRLIQILREEKKQEQVEYLEALKALEDVQKQQKDANKDWQREFAGKQQASSFGYVRDAADKVRKDLGESPKDKAWEAIKKATEEAEGGDKKPESGEPEKKPTEGEKPKAA